MNVLHPCPGLAIRAIPLRMSLNGATCHAIHVSAVCRCSFGIFFFSILSCTKARPI